MALKCPSFPLLGRIALTLAIGCAGGYLFVLLGMPAAWLSGSMVAVSVAALAGVPMELPNSLRNVLFVVLGLSMGTGVRPEVVDRVSQWPLSLLILMVLIVTVTAATFVFLRYLVKWNRQTAFFAAIPGALSFVVALAVQSTADLRLVAISQTTRVFFLVAILPPLISSTVGEGGDVVVQAIPFHWNILLLTLAACAAAGWLAERLSVPAGWLTGSFFLSSLLNGTGLVPLAIPDAAVAPAYIGLGAVIGARLGGASLRLLLGVMGASVGAFAVGISISAVFSVLIASLTDIPFGQAMLAYAPGGLEAMTLLSFMLGLDPAYVATHQLVRYMVMVFAMPVAVRLVLGRDWRAPRSG